MSISLKHIPCPAGSRCTAFHCIFGHEGDKDQQASATAEAQDEKLEHGKASGPSSPNDHGPPRKRLKVDAVPSVKPVRDSPSNENTEISHHGSSTIQLQTATQPVSPPLSRPRAPTTTMGAADSHSSPSSSSMPQQAASSKRGPPSQKKAESLNPRLLKSSPARHETRLKLLRMLHQEYSRLNSELKKNGSRQERKLVLSDQDLIIKALDEEQKTALEKAAVYSNVMKNKVVQYKRMKVDQWVKDREEEEQTARRKQGNGTLDEPKKIRTGLSQAQEVRLLERIITPVDGLASHGYVAAVPSEESITAARKGLEASKGWEKCDRCQQRFQVFPGRREEDGALTSGGTCNFHWGKTYFPVKAPGSRAKVIKRYHCCGQEVGESAGCSTHDHHVYKYTDARSLAAVLNFAETPENSVAPADRAVCFDCEMAYTVYGMELVRLTATSWPAGDELLDVLVQPMGEILDLNSRYSGVWPDDLAQAEPWAADQDSAPAKSGEDACSEEGEVMAARRKLRKVPSPEAARRLLFSLISPSTPLIGHGLENDLNAVRIVHPSLIDTVLLYPHQGGLPYRHSLKKLMETHLDRKIQQETGPKMLGHDSAEDARAAGELVLLKVKDLWSDMRRLGWKLVDGDLVGPGQDGDEKGKLTEEFIEA